MNTNTHQRRKAFISYRIFFAVNSLSQGYRSAPHCRLCYSGSFLPLAPLLSPTVARNKKSSPSPLCRSPSSLSSRRSFAAQINPQTHSESRRIVRNGTKSCPPQLSVHCATCTTETAQGVNRGGDETRSAKQKRGTKIIHRSRTLLY